MISRRQAPLLLRLSYHDAVSFDSRSGLGGANGSIRLAEELGRPENHGLAEALDLLQPVKQSFEELSWADLIALAGAVAVSQTGGPEIAIPLGRMH